MCCRQSLLVGFGFLATLPASVWTGCLSGVGAQELLRLWKVLGLVLSAVAGAVGHRERPALVSEQIISVFMVEETEAQGDRISLWSQELEAAGSGFGPGSLLQTPDHFSVLPL